MLALVTDAFGGQGGIAAATRATLSGFAGSGHCRSIQVLPRLAPDTAGALPDKIRQTPPHHNRFAFAFTSAAHALRRRPSVVYCNHVFMAPLARLIARATGAKLILHVHGIEIWRAPRPAQRVALEAADVVVSVSRHTRRMVLGQASLSPERVVVVGNTIDASFTPGDRATARQRLGLSAESVLLLTVGRLAAAERYKGHDRVFDALAAIAPADRQKILYVVAGEGDDRARLEALARDQALENVVRFVGYTKGDDLLNLYRAADIFVMPSTGEGFGIAFLEAMACGTPVLGLAVAGAKDALAEGELGKCVAAENFAETLAEMIERRSRPDNLPAIVQARFGAAVFRAQLEHVLSSLAGEGGAGLPPPRLARDRSPTGA